MYEVGSKIVYGSEGVCTIEKIDNLNIKGISKDKMYYYLSPVYSGGTIYAPVDTPVKMRQVISKSKAIEFIKLIPEIPAQEINTTNTRELTEHYQSIIKTGECYDLVRVIKAIFNRRLQAMEKGKKLGSVEEKYFNKAKDMLYGELAVSLDKEKSQVEDYITQMINENSK